MTGRFIIWLALFVPLFTSAFAAGTAQRERMQTVASILSTVDPTGAASLSIPDGKCGTRLGAAITEHWRDFSLAQQIKLRQLMAPQEYQKVRVIGRYEIHYDTSGDNSPAMLDQNGERIPNSAEEYIDSVGRYANYAYKIEIDSLHFQAPPVAAGHAGYEIDIVEFNGSLYGRTFADDQVNPGETPPRYTAHIEIDNDFRGYYSSGVAGLKVTVAHEFHHVTQFGSYAFWGFSAIWFYEISAVWMEDFVHNDVNDYYNYLRTPGLNPRGTFENPEYSFAMSNGLIEYSRAIWGKYIEQRFSSGMMRHIWEAMRASTVLPAMNRALADSGSSFQRAFLEWTSWNYRTGRRADTVNCYHEGRQYPEISERETTYYYSPSGSFHDSVQSLGSAYHPVLLNGLTRIYSIVSNVNASPPSFFSYQPFTYLMANAGDASYKKLDSLVYIKLDVADPFSWKTQESVPGIEPVLSADGDVYVFPSPYFVPWAGGVTFELPANTYSTAHLFVLSMGMHVVVNRELPIVPDLHGKPSLVWHPEDESSPSGVYAYYITVGDKAYRGKLSIVRR